MSMRDAFPKARLPRSHYFITFARGEDMRCFALRPWALCAIGIVFPLTALAYVGATAVYVMRDEMLSSMMQRQSAMQVAYEDRLADMRIQLDRVTSNQLLDQNSLEARIHDLISRQARLESRSSMVASLAAGAGISAPATPSQRQPARAAAALPINPLLGNLQKPLPAGISAYAPTSHGAAATSVIRSIPRPGAVEVQSSGEKRVQRGASLAPGDMSVIAADPNLPAEIRIGSIVRSLDRLEAEQIRSVNVIAAQARKTETQLRQAIAATGLPVEKLQAPAGKTARAMATGGPFVPFKLDPNGSPFEREVLRLQGHVEAADRYRRVAVRLPLRVPLAGNPEITSGFGSRVDPFNGRMASHTGIDFRQAYGSPVRATAAGTVISAAPQGGYGNMVEVDHGNGVTSRYAHMSAILVKSGQTVLPGSILGRLGSTGRSTGPHLHYEVRYNEQPLNPRRFLTAGLKLPL